MQVIVFGRDRTIQRLTVFLAGEGIEPVVTSDELDKMLTLQEQDRFDLAIVDDLTEKAEAICHRIRKSGKVPLVLMVGQKQPDWERLESLGADGYLPQEAKDTELAARLRAILRRFCPGGPVGKSTPSSVNDQYNLRGN